MRIELDASREQRIPIPWRPARIYVRRADTDAARVVLYWRNNPRGTEVVLAHVSVVNITQDVEHADLVIGPGGTGHVELLVDRGEGFVPVPISASPRGGRIQADTLTLTTEHVRLPPYELMEDRDMIIMAADDNTGKVYVNGFPLGPGTGLSVRPARLDDIEVWADVDGDRVHYVAEVRG
ncbi:MAG: hypothetical protein QXQ53_03810 [Candidatus Methanosuratincola sp.]